MQGVIKFILSSSHHLIWQTISFSMTKNSGSNASARPRTLVAKPAAKEPSKVMSIHERKELLEKWTSHVALYQQSLGTSSPGIEPSRTHFEEINGLGLGTVGYLIKSSELANMVPDLSKGRKYARAEVRLFYPIEKIVDKLTFTYETRKSLSTCGSCDSWP